jgi:hypothetical protein
MHTDDTHAPRSPTERARREDEHPAIDRSHMPDGLVARMAPHPAQETRPSGGVFDRKGATFPARVSEAYAGTTQGRDSTVTNFNVIQDTIEGR